MEKIKNATLKRALVCAVSFTVSAVVLLSAFTIYLCYRLQKAILPDSNKAILSITSVYPSGSVQKEQHTFEFGEETAMGVSVGISYDGRPSSGELAKVEETVSAAFTVDRIDNSFSMLPPRRKAAYMTLAAAKVALPLFYAVLGIVLCAAWFYRKKLSVPIGLLSAAAEHISKQDLDFQVSYASADEMGMLCRSFEEMRRTLYEKNRELWGMIEGRRTLMASVAHDLRNPISIMEGYLEYLQEHLADRDIAYEDALDMVKQVMTAAGRLERYTDSLRDIHLMEEQELQESACALPKLLDEMAETFRLLGEKRRIEVEVDNWVPACRVLLDGQILYRILENVFVNALRFAKMRIHIDFALQGNDLVTQVADDGAGFSEKLLRADRRLFFTTDTSGEHMGMGLTVCEILSRKHGGSLTFSNPPDGGACVTVRITVRRATS